MEASLNRALETLRREVLSNNYDPEDVYSIVLSAPAVGIGGNALNVRFESGQWSFEVVKNGHALTFKVKAQTNAQIVLEEFIEAFGSLDKLVSAELVLAGEVYTI